MIMVFRKGGRLPDNLAFYYDGHQLEIVNKYTYLGIVFTSGGSFSEACSTLSGQALKAIFKLRNYLFRYTSISVDHVLSLFDKLVRPILFYGAEVWGFLKANQIERIHTLFCKRTLGVKSSTQNDFIYGELGRQDLYSSRLVSIIKYWLRIMSSDSNKYVLVMYKTMLRDLELHPQKPNWASSVRDTLGRLGFFHDWEAQGVGDNGSFISLFKQRCKDIFVQEWYGRIERSTRATFYKTFCSFGLRIYLSSVNVNKYRILLRKKTTEQSIMNCMYIDFNTLLRKHKLY